ncbi:MAG: hypothetical protein KTR30_04610 [Saprospiraceae bacterium]|nr:hypothetical protein [Saprospiraceae bacterium]
MRAVSLSIYLLLQICFSSLHAAVPQVINFEKSTYQAHSQNWSITQHPQGFLYFGNSSGMLEFDGQDWSLYHLPEKQKVRAVASDEEGRIYVGGYGEFGYWKADAKGQLHYHSISTKSSIESIHSEEIWHILRRDSLVFFQSFGTVYKYNVVKDDLLEIRPPANILFAQLVGNRIIFPGIHGALFEWSSSKGYQALQGTEILAGKRSSFLLPFQGGILIGTRLQGLFFYKDGKCSVMPHPLNESLKRYEINCGRKLSDGRIVIGSILNGVYLLEVNGQLSNHVNKAKGLQNNTILYLFEDQAKNVWAGLDSGIDLLVLNDAEVYLRDNSGELGTLYASTIVGDHLYLGTNHGVFYRDFQTVNEPFQLIEGSQGQVWQLQEFEGELICGHNLGTFHITEGEITRISELTGGWSTIQLDTNRLLQGTYTGLAYYENKSTGQWQFLRKIEGLNEPVEKVVKEDETHFWLLHPYRGIKRAEIDSTFSRITNIQSFTKEEGLATEFNLDLFKVDQKVILRSGEAYWKWNGFALEECSEIYEVAITPNSLIVEGAGEDWFKILDGELEWWHGNRLRQKLSSVLLVGEVRILPLDEKQYLLCAEDEYILLRDEDAFPTPKHLAPIIRAIEYSNYPIDSLLDLTAADFQIDPNWNDLSFSYASPVFTEKVQFRYRLDPIYPNWSAWESANRREFNNLPPGEYTFELKSDLTPDITRFSFEILPRWYQTNWSLILFLATFILFLLLLRRWHHRRLANQRRRLEAEKERQLHQQKIQARNERLELDLQNKSREMANSTFNLVQKNETLLKIKDGLQHIKKEVGTQFPEPKYNSLIRLINDQLHSRKDWELFEESFHEVHQEFFRRLLQHYPSLTTGDLRLAAYLRMSLSSKEIAPLLFISVRGVENKRYRLRKKLQLPNEDKLSEYLITF